MKPIETLADEGGEVRLPGGDTVDPTLFEDLEIKLLEHEGGEEDTGWQNRFSRRKSEDPITPMTAHPSISVQNVAGVRHRERSRASQTADEAFNAPVAKSYEQWLQNPNRYDLPGVDTIPHYRYVERAEDAVNRGLEAGVIKKVQKGALESGGSTKGRFKPIGSRVQTQFPEDLEDEPPHFQFGPVLAHEMGHAIDRGAMKREVLVPAWDDIDPDVREMFNEFGTAGETRYFSELELEADPDLREQAERLSIRSRGDVEAGSDSQRSYRAEPTELMADAIGSVLIEPRAAKREAPELTAKIERDYLPVLESGGA